MTPEEKVRSAFVSFCRQMQSGASLPATVESVDLKEETCSVKFLDDDLAPHHGVHLSAGTGSKNTMLIVPKVGSTVYISFMGDDDVWAYVAKTSIIDMVLLRGDEWGGLIKIEKLVERLNAIEKQLNLFMTEYKAHVHPGVITGPAATSPTVSALINIEPTQRAALENKKVKHG